MRLLFGFVADSAQSGPDGKIHALGAGIDQIKAPAYPFVVPILTLVFRVGFAPSEIGQTLKLHLAAHDPSGAATPVVSAEMTPTQPPQGTEAAANILVGVQGLELTSPGEYSWTLSNEAGEIIGRLAVVGLEPPAPESVSPAPGRGSTSS